MMRVTGKKLLLAWFLTIIVVSVVSTLVTMTYWQLTYVPEMGTSWRPFDDLGPALVSLPIGFLFSILLPPGWLNIAGFCLCSRNLSFKPLLFCAAGSILMGVGWPVFFVTAMGV